MDLRADIRHMLRTRWWLVAAWGAVVAGVATAGVVGGWARPMPAPSDLRPVSSEAEAERVLREFANTRLAYGTYDDSDPAGHSDDSAEAPSPLAESMADAEARCATSLPFERDFRGYQSRLHVRILQVRHSKQARDEYDTEAAPRARTFVEVTAAVEHDGDESEYPSSHVRVVDREGRSYEMSWEVPTLDWLGPVDAGTTRAGVLMFEVRTPEFAQPDPLYIVVSGDLYDERTTATALEDGKCVRVVPVQAAAVGDSPLVEDGELVP